MIAMTPTMTLKGTMKFSLKKALTGGDMSKSQYTGPGELLLAPSAIGDITIIKLGSNDTWSCGKDAFLACTQGIVTEYKSQSLSKAMFSGEGLFVYKISGQGVLWCASFGAIIRKDVWPLSLYFFYPALIHRTATKRRKVHHRQRPPRCLELQIRNGARSIWRPHVEYDGRRRAGVQIYGPRHGFHANEESPAILGVVGGEQRCCLKCHGEWWEGKKRWAHGREQRRRVTRFLKP